MKVLAVIASYGHTNNLFLQRALQEYRRMRYAVDIIVLSNIPKNLGPDIQVVVGLPNGDPWSLPFAHKKIFADRANDYDLFLYSEDDVLVTERNLDAFLRTAATLPQDEIAGFLRTETDEQGRLYYIDAHSHYHWEVGSVRSRGEYTFAFFTNEHAAFYLLTRDQLKRAIQSGGFLVGPHEEKYDLLVTAATDPYTQCGFKKMICVSHLDDFTVLHLPNKKHNGRPYEERLEFHKQIEALLKAQKNGTPRTMLFEPDSKVGRGKWAKSYYEPYDPFSGRQTILPDIVSHVPSGVRSVLSVGCGWGGIEAELVRRGIRVVGIPLDPVIAACAEAKGVEVVDSDFEAARNKLASERFDCVLMSYVLHLVPDPLHVLSSFTELLSAQGCVVVSVPNFAQVGVVWRRMRRDPQYRELGNYENSGLHLTTHRVIGKWFQSCDLRVDKMVDLVPKQARWAYRLSPELAGPALASDFIAIGRGGKVGSSADR
jgi:2-polyprenyl-3-methyl-5-hydroxy-6-metoxy-1,4-benzoquinol methylase